MPPKKTRKVGYGFGPADLISGLIKGAKSSKVISQALSMISPKLGQIVRSYGFGKKRKSTNKKRKN